MYASCQGGMWAVPRSAAGAYLGFGGLLSLVNNAYTQVRSQQNCRASLRSNTLTDEAFRVRFNTIPESLIYPFTTPIGSANLGPTMSDWHFNASSTRLSMPATCTYSEVASSGDCSGTFTGLSELLGTEIRINFFAKHCSGWTLNPEMYAECVGEGCSILNNGFRPCTSNADCSGTLSCRSMQNIVEAWRFTESSSNSIDAIGSMLYGSSEATTCRSNSKLFEDLNYIAARTIGLNPATPAQAPTGFCFFDTGHIYNTVQTWGEGQSTTSGSIITVPDLYAWLNPSTPVASAPGTIGEVTYPSNVVPSAASQVLVSVAVALAAAFALLF
jgi:hypothetical protein